MSDGQKASPGLGLLLMLAEAFVLAVAALVVKLLKKDFGAFELVFCRSIILFLGSAWHGEKPTSLLALRAACGIGYTASYYYALHRLVLSDAVVITYTSPVLTALAAALLLREPWGGLDALGSLLSMLGVLLIVKPGYVSVDQHLDGVLAAMLAALCSTAVYLLVRHMKAVPFVVMLNYGAMAGLLLGPIGGYLAGERWSHHSLRDWTVVALIAGLSVSHQSLMYLGLSMLAAAKATAMNYSQVVFALLFQIFLLREPTDALSICGSTLITTWGVIALVKDREVHPALHEDEDPELDLLNKGQGSTPSLEANF